MMIPACSNWSLYSDTVLILFVLKALVNFFELFFVGFETVTGEPFVFSCIRWILIFLCLKESFFLFEGEWIHSESFDNSAPFLSYGHLVALQVLILIVFPVQEYLFFLLSICKVDKLSFQNYDSVLLLFGYFWNKIVNIFKHLAVEFTSVFFRWVYIYSSMYEIKLLFKDTIRTLISQSCSYYLHKFMWSHLGIFYHLEETSPNEGTT